MKANLSIHFSELFTDTIRAHGLRYCFEYYRVKHKMELWEPLFWINSTKGKL